MANSKSSSITAYKYHTLQDFMEIFFFQSKINFGWWLGTLVVFREKQNAIGSILNMLINIR